QQCTLVEVDVERRESVGPPGKGRGPQNVLVTNTGSSLGSYVLGINVIQSGSYDVFWRFVFSRGGE
ncbi:hypothetical protein AMQ83_26740, partial [Paenibacillus riograndensis]